MTLFVVSAILLIVSFVMSLLSLKKDLKKPVEIEHAKEDLSKEKILYSRS